MITLTSTFSMMSLSSAGVIPTVQPPLNVSVTLPCVRSTTGLHGACVRKSCAGEIVAQRSDAVATTNRATAGFMKEPARKGIAFETPE